MRTLLGTGGVFYFAWVIPGAAFVCLFALAYLGFLLAMPRPIAMTMVLAGIIYVSGAIGAEMVGSII